MTTMAIAHGMDGTLVVPDWPPLTLSEVREVLSLFEKHNEPIRILSTSPRPFSAASIVATQDGNVFLKRHHVCVRNCAGLQEEHAFIAHLSSHGMQVPRVLPTRTGKTAIEIGEWTYEVHETTRGIDLYEDAPSWTPFLTAGHAHSAGQTLARLHLAADGYAAPARRNRPLVAGFTIFAAQNAVDAFDLYTASRPALHAYLQKHNCQDVALELLSPFHRELLPLLPSLSPLWTHNDLHASNLFWSHSGDDARVASVIDFGLSDRTNAVHDIAHAIERNIVEWLALTKDCANLELVSVHLDHLESLLCGYESIRALSTEEAAALAPMTALCHAEFALSETNYFYGTLHSEEKAAIACEGYLLLHAQWFRGAGRRLLDAVRQWANRRSRA